MYTHYKLRSEQNGNIKEDSFIMTEVFMESTVYGTVPPEFSDLASKVDFYAALRFYTSGS